MTATVTIVPVRTAEEFAVATAHLRTLIDSDDVEAHVDEIAAQAQLIDAYEKVHFPIPAPDLLSAVRFRMDQEGLDRSDLAKLLGVERSRVSELLGGKRQFTISMLRALHQKWQFPAHVLLNNPAPKRRTRSRR